MWIFVCNRTATKYATQVVAGLNYFVVCKAGDEYIHVRIYQNLQGARSVDGVRTGKTAADALEYFQG